MNTTELLQRISCDRTSSYGHFRINIQYRGKKYSCITTNAPAYDYYDNEERKGSRYYSQLDALKDLWRECKRQNNLK
jgi:hypothetical protein